MNILFCGDANISDGVMISALSLLHNTKDALNIYIMTASVKTKEREFVALDSVFSDFLCSALKEYDSKNSVMLIDVTDKFSADPPLANMETRFTPCCMLRLYADLVEELPDRLLYLDNDTICNAGISELYNIDMKGYEIAGVLDHYGSHFFRKKIFKRDYLNSGVLLLNMAKIRESGLFEKCRVLCRDKEMFMPDQSALNKLASKRILPRRYNEQRKLRDDTVIQHFTTSFRFFPWIHTVSVKPWNIEGMHNTLKLFKYDPLLEEYQALKKIYATKGEKANV